MAPEDNNDLESREAYNDRVASLRQDEYPPLKETTYLDHAAMPPVPASLLSAFTSRLASSVISNPHSESSSWIDAIRIRACRWLFKDQDLADQYDLIFSANATAALKIVVEAMDDLVESDGKSGWRLLYHVDSHTSVVGMRSHAKEGSYCFEDEDDLQQHMGEAKASQENTSLLVWPVQSNLDGRVLPWWLAGDFKAKGKLYSVLDASALLSTSRLIIDLLTAPDMIVLSFYKIFGFPDLGGLLVKKHAADLFGHRRYFGGGTVDAVIVQPGFTPYSGFEREHQWRHKSKTTLHDALEDGTLPVHSILALDCAMDTHERLYGSQDEVSRHVAWLRRCAVSRLEELRHSNGEKIVELLYQSRSPSSDSRYGPVLALNLRDKHREYISPPEVEKLAHIRNIKLRVGAVCNPGGVARTFGISPSAVRENYENGARCSAGSEGAIDPKTGRPTGVVRISFGASSTMADIDRFEDFVREFFLEKADEEQAAPDTSRLSSITGFYISSLSIYPIKSCGSYEIPPGTRWRLFDEGLELDREWCVVDISTGAALNQKRHPSMAFVRVSLDTHCRKMTISYVGRSEKIVVSLDDTTEEDTQDMLWFKDKNKKACSTVCGDEISLRIYTSSAIINFFSSIVGIPATLARFPPSNSRRHAKPHLISSKARLDSLSNRRTNGNLSIQERKINILLSNESPVLVVSQSSLNSLNEEIKLRRGKAAAASAFRANIVISEKGRPERAYLEDEWSGLRITPSERETEGRGDEQVELDLLGPCRRCQMVCIDQITGEKNEEPFVTLAKTRRREGKVWFGVHACLKSEKADRDGRKSVWIGVGDEVEGML